MSTKNRPDHGVCDPVHFLLFLDDRAGLDPIVGKPRGILLVRFYSGLCTFFSAFVYTRMTFWSMDAQS